MTATGFPPTPAKPPTLTRFGFENAEPVRSFRWAKGQKHFPGWWWSSTGS